MTLYEENQDRKSKERLTVVKYDRWPYEFYRNTYHKPQEFIDIVNAIASKYGENAKISFDIIGDGGDYIVNLSICTSRLENDKEYNDRMMKLRLDEYDRKKKQESEEAREKRELARLKAKYDS